MHISISMPDNWHPKPSEKNFKFDDTRTNKKEARRFLQYEKHNTIETIEGCPLIQIPKHMDFDGQQVHEIGLIEKLNPPYLSYCVKFVDFKFHRLHCATQVRVWHSGHHGGITKHVFYNVILDQYDAVITDTMQSAEGRRFWENQWYEAFRRQNFYVYYIDLERSLYQPVRTDLEFHHVVMNREPWGDGVQYNTRRFMISNEDLRHFFETSI